MKEAGFLSSTRRSTLIVKYKSSTHFQIRELKALDISPEKIDAFNFRRVESSGKLSAQPLSFRGAIKASQPKILKVRLFYLRYAITRVF